MSMIVEYRAFKSYDVEFSKFLRLKNYKIVGLCLHLVGSSLCKITLFSQGQSG